MHTSKRLDLKAQEPLRHECRSNVALSAVGPRARCTIDPRSTKSRRTQPTRSNPVSASSENRWMLMGDSASSVWQDERWNEATPAACSYVHSDIIHCHPNDDASALSMAHYLIGLSRMVRFTRVMTKETRLTFRVRAELKKSLEAIAAKEARSVAQGVGAHV